MEAGGLVTGTSGNVSARDAESGLVAISPTSIPYGRMRPEDVSVVDAEGGLLDGAAPSVELPMHLAIQSGRPEVGAIVHTHSPYATALGAVAAVAIGVFGPLFDLSVAIGDVLAACVMLAGPAAGYLTEPLCFVR